MPYMQHDYAPAEDLLNNRIILVTGAGSGIGRAVSKSLAAHGATVVLCGPIQRQLEDVYDEIEATASTQPAMYVLDLDKAKEEEYAGLAGSLAQEFGRLDGLLHNAAVLPFLSRIDDYDLQPWEQTMRVNVTAPLLLTQACLPLLRQSADGSILFTSDAVGRKGKAYWGAYGVSKFAIEGLMQILAEELRDSSKIRVNSIDPGPVRTDLRIKVFPGTNPTAWALPDDIVRPYLYLLGPDSREATGLTHDAQAAEL